MGHCLHLIHLMKFLIQAVPHYSYEVCPALSCIYVTWCVGGLPCHFMQMYTSIKLVLNTYLLYILFYYKVLNDWVV